MFNSLSSEHIHEIIDIELKMLFERIIQLGYSLSLDKKAKDFIADKGYDSQFGARPLKRAIQKYLEDLIAEEIVNANLQEGDDIKISLDEEKGELKVKIKKPKKEKPQKPKKEE
jgi:ATP-dependent Clp protease ATP-binding subunit ClpC